MGLLNAVREKLRARRIKQFMARVTEDNAAFDRRYGTDTAAKFFLDAYDLDDEQKEGVEYYQGVHEGILRRIIETLAPHPEEFDFIDIGSGKGKALLVASTYPFKRVRGVEISQKLTDVANQNIEKFAASGLVRCGDVVPLCQDARAVDDFRGRTFVFMLNPFHEEPMREVAPRLAAIANEPGKSMLIAYLTPGYRGALDASSGLKTLFDSFRFVLYASPNESISAEAHKKLEDTFTNWQI